MSTPIFKLVFDRQKRASKTKEGSVELRITYKRVQRFATTGVRVLPSQWKDGKIVKRLDAFEIQHALDLFVAKARKVVNELMATGELDMKTIVSIIGEKQKSDSSSACTSSIALVDYFNKRMKIRTYGKSNDSRDRYERFIRWFSAWGGMITFSDVTELNIIKMDEALNATGMKPYSKWNNYHRFLNSYIIDAMNEGIIRKNPYSMLHIDKSQTSDALSKHLTKEEVAKISALNPIMPHIERAKDLFLFQIYTCLSYVDLVAFDASKIKEVNGRKMYVGLRGKTKQEFVFLLLKPALDILNKYDGKLPIISNQKYNDYIKLVANMAGIEKPVSSHWARHTGATLLLNSGANMEIVAKVLGHSSTTITRQVYAKLLDDTVIKEMTALEGVIID